MASKKAIQIKLGIRLKGEGDLSMLLTMLPVESLIIYSCIKALPNIPRNIKSLEPRVYMDLLRERKFLARSLQAVLLEYGDKMLTKSIQRKLKVRIMH